jgi:hypothetical protein
MKQLKLQFSIRITEGTNVLTDDDRNLNICDFPLNDFTIDPDVEDIDFLYDEFIEKYYPDCKIFEPTFLIYPIINDEVLDIELSEEIDPDGVWLLDIENWLKEKHHIQWLRVYQLENNLGII